MTAERYDHAALVRGWLHEPIELSPIDAGRIERRIEQAPQQRGWLLPLTPRRFQTMFSATKFVVAGVIVALFGSFVVAGVLPQTGNQLPIAGAVDTSPSPVVVASVDSTELPADQAAPPSQLATADANSGTLDTPAGTFEWRRIRGDDVPGRPGEFQRGQIIEWHDGSFAFPVRRRERAVVWTSDDGTKWQSQQLPAELTGEGDRLFHVDGVSWFMSGGGCCKVPRTSPISNRYVEPKPLRIWRSDDGDTWIEMVAGSVPLPGPAGLNWGVGVQGAATSTMGVLVESAGARFPIDRLTGTACQGKDELRQRGAGVYAVRKLRSDDNPRNVCGTWTRLRFVETDDGLRVLDDRTGKRVGRIEGAELADLDRFAGNARLGVDYGTRVITANEAGVTVIEAPWTGRGLELQALAAFGDAVLAYLSEDSAEGTVSEVWRTTDGMSWTDLGPAALPGDAPPGSRLHITTWPGRVSISTGDEGGTHGWTTTDGVTWIPEPTGWPEGAPPFALASGWMAAEVLPGYRGDAGDSVWMYAGGEWVSLDPLGFDCGDAAGSTRTSFGAVGDTTFIWAHRGCEPVKRGTLPDLWVLSPSS